MEEQQFSTLIYYLNVKRPMDLLISLFDIFSSDQTMISLEGDLSYCDTRGLKVILQEPHGILDEQIIPKEGRLILSLISSSKDCFVRNIFPRIGIRKRSGIFLFLFPIVLFLHPMTGLMKIVFGSQPMSTRNGLKI